MARGFISAMNKMARAAAKAQRVAEQRQRAAQREYERQKRLQRQYELKIARDEERSIKQSIREQKAFEKEQKALYIQARKQETEDLNNEIQYIIEEFQSVLLKTLDVDDTISFDSLYHKEKFREFKAPTPLSIPYFPKPNREDYFKNIQEEPPFLEKLFGIGKSKRLEEIRRAEASYNNALAEHDKSKIQTENIKKENEKAMQVAKEQYEQEKVAFEKELQLKNQEVDAFKDKYFSADKEAIEAYNAMVLERSDYSDIFPQEFDLFYIPESKELIIEYELPSSESLPKYKEFKYVQSRDEIKGTEYKAKERNEIFTNLIASIALRTLHEVFESDQANSLDSVVFNGVVATIDPSNGLEIRPCIITIQSKKEEFLKLDLSRVDVISCVKGLRAQISPSMTELAPVKPIVNFEMLDKRFVNEKDMLSDLDERTNLLEMDPFDFEHLVCNLFAKIGLESKLTRSSRDGGVDAIAFDPRPVFGGKYVIQAKRYRNVVDVAAVRDLYGTMMNENAAKGILVTTSNYGPDARSFAKDKPIELIDGSNLLYMLEEQGIRAKIVVPK